MPKVIFLVGLCGSGKSRFGMTRATPARLWVGEGIGSDPVKYQEMIRLLKAGKECYAEEFFTLTPAQRKHLESRIRQDCGDPTDLTVEFWYFEKDKDKATRNILSRPDEEKAKAAHLAINDVNFNSYEIPQGAVVMEIEPPTPYVKPV